MKTKRLHPYSIQIFGLLIVLAFITILSTDSFGQNSLDDGNKVRTVYVISGADEKVEITRPRISNLKNDTEFKTSRAAYGLEKTAFHLINKRRAEYGLKPVQWSDNIATLARQHSLNMADNRFFSHKSLNGMLIDERANALGIDRWKAIGENIAFNQGFQNPVEFAVERWMKSPGHRQNILNPRWQQSGIGVAVNQDGAYYFTQVFLDK